MAPDEYLVAHGATGVLGRFRSAGPLALQRGDRVAVRSGRGVEVGEVLRPATPRHADLLGEPTCGELLRTATAEDEARAVALAARAGELLARGTELADQLGLAVAPLDAEILLDGEHAVLYHVRWGDADLRELVAPLSRQFELSVFLVDLTAAQAEHGCGGCGTSGCGTGCNSCGSVSAEELQVYFAGLREKMEQDARRRVPLL